MATTQTESKKELSTEELGRKVVGCMLSGGAQSSPLTADEILADLREAGTNCSLQELEEALNDIPVVAGMKLRVVLEPHSDATIVRFSLYPAPHGT